MKAKFPFRKNGAIKNAHKLKRAMDIAICLASLPVLVPLGCLLMVLVCLDGHGAPIYTQERIGRRGKTFRLFKFRTMARDADSRLLACLKDNPLLASEWAACHKLKSDPRLTRIGGFLRKTSLDELPQIINVLLGEMSLVGPRPIVQGETQKYGRFFREYCQTLPGISGLWQISGRNNTTYRRRVACDYYYINNWTIWLDLWILLRTVPVAVRGDGAY